MLTKSFVYFSLRKYQENLSLLCSNPLCSNHSRSEKKGSTAFVSKLKLTEDDEEEYFIVTRGDNIPDEETAKHSEFQFNYVSDEHKPKIYHGTNIFDVTSTSQWFWTDKV